MTTVGRVLVEVSSPADRQLGSLFWVQVEKAVTYLQVSLGRVGTRTKRHPGTKRQGNRDKKAPSRTVSLVWFRPLNLPDYELDFPRHCADCAGGREHQARSALSCYKKNFFSGTAGV